ncbi:MAG: MBL fold metallo-hydrolase [Verrucomicrobia bacterium]|nr:MBL fold metallo-hydrolase [Verrucomicrobiota bacterium]
MHTPAQRIRALALLSLLPASLTCAAASSQLTEIVPGLHLVSGAVNGARLERAGKTLAVYGDPRENPPPADTVLLTHHRRDVVAAALGLLAAGVRVVAPEAELASFTQVEEFWSGFETKRFHDYAQQTTKVLRQPIAVDRAVRGGETFTWNELEVQVLDAPGYTRGAVAYLIELAGVRIAFTGELIYGDGRLFDLYSLQDAIPAAKVGGYHGYAARLGELMTSLERLTAAQPDLLIPARGPVIRQPAEAIALLRSRIRAFYANYLSIDASRWHFRDEHMLAKAKRVLGPEATVDWMPLAETVQDLPPWIVPISNARLILSADKKGFLIDCGSQRIIDELKKLQAAGQLDALEHVFVTHYHDDHTDQVAKVVEWSGATVHASRENWDILTRPAAYRLPCLTTNPIHVSGRPTSGAPWRWREFEIALTYFPGQTFHHDALLVKKEGADPILFIGDSFTPSGIDDYCLLNRNLLHPGMGYFFCLDYVKRQAPEALLINQHLQPTFRFSAAQLDHMQTVLEQRVALLGALFPWDDPNYGLDEGWARFYPYAAAARAGETLELELRLWNHSPRERLFRPHLQLPAGWSLTSASPNPIRVSRRQEGVVQLRLTVPVTAKPGRHILTTDLQTEGWHLREWTEAMITVSAAN